MIASCTWEINGVACMSSIRDALMPWPELRHKALTEASPMDDEDPDSECSFSVAVAGLDLALPIMAAFVKEGAGYHLALNCYVETPFGKICASLCDDRNHAQAYPATSDARVIEAAIAAHKRLGEALDALGKDKTL